MDKGKRVEIIAHVLENFHTAGVATQAMGIFGLPGESEADGEETVHFLETNAEHISYYVMGLLMVLPGSRMHSDPASHGVSAISYDQNPLKTPEPVWRSATRMSIDSVNRLYERLSRLEQIYAIDEYPYVGGLCTNHGFLYYTLGPDILKRLRQDEQAALTRIGRLLGMEGASPDTKKIKKMIPRMRLPHHIQRSRFALHRLAAEAGRTHKAERLGPTTENSFMLLPGHGRQMPVMIDHREVTLLNRIDGRRTLWAVFKKVDKTELRRALSFIWYLVQAEAIELL